MKFVSLGVTSAVITLSIAPSTIAYRAEAEPAVMPAATIRDVSVREGDAGRNDAAFTVTLSGPSAATASIDYASADGTAAAGSDYVAVSGTLVFPPGVTSQTILVPILGDVTIEPDETLALNLGTATNVTIANPSAVGTIVNDDSTWQRVRDGASHFEAVASGGTAYVAVGDYGDIWRSLDGISWKRRFNPDPSSTHLYGVAYGGGQFVAVGWGGTGSGVLLTSAKGRKWTLRDARPASTNGDVPLSGVAYGDGLYVAVGARGTVITSPDAVAWTLRAAPPTAALRAVGFGGGVFVAVGANKAVLRSTDGISWTTVPVPPIVATNFLVAVAYTGSQFVVTGDDMTLLTSPDGSTWTAHAVPCCDYYGVASNASSIVVVGSDWILTSPDGVVWTNAPVPAASPGEMLLMTAVTFGRRFVAVGYGGAILTSEDGTSGWTSRTAPGSRELRAVAGTAAVDCAVGTSGAVSRSTDGITWTNETPAVAPYPNPYEYWATVERRAGTFAAMAAAPTIMTSTDCATWVIREPLGVFPPTPPEFYWQVTRGHGLFVAVGVVYGPTHTPAIATSPDGILWTRRSPGTPADGQSRHATSIAFGGGQFVVSGYEGEESAVFNGRPFVLTSTDGIAWTMRDATGLPGGLADLAFRNGTFVGVGYGIWSSEDGPNWTSRQASVTPTGGLQRLNAVTATPDGFVAAGEHGAIASSADGHLWTIAAAPTSHPLFGLAYSRVYGGVVAVGGSVIVALPNAPAGSASTDVTRRP
jgi:hypothetical protein